MTENPTIPYQVLLIEPNSEGAVLVTRWLEDYFVQITVASRIDDSNILRGNWSLIILSIEYFDTSCQQILSLIRSVNPTAPILLLMKSGKESENLSINSLTTVFYKPLERANFVEVFQKILSPTGDLMAVDRRRTPDRRRKQRKVILAIGAHPDDVEIGCGGTLLRHYMEGCSVNILTLSSGQIGGDGETRKHESELTAELLHAKLYWGNLIDTEISEGASTIDVIQEVVKEVNPTHVYTHSIHDDHQDHRNTYLASMIACRLIPNIYGFQSPSARIDFQPNLFIDISKYIDQKLTAIKIFETQFSKRPYLHHDMIRAVARYWGRYTDYGFAEAMEIIRQQYQ